MSQIGARMAENMMQTPKGKFSKHWTEPQRFPQFLVEPPDSKPSKPKAA